MQHEFIELIKYRLEKAKSDLSAAKILLEKNLLEQSLNRSYYSIFHTTRALLVLNRFDSKKHSGIISFFNKHYIATEIFSKEYSKILMGAERVRNQSDYDDFFIISKKDTEKQVKNATKFMNMVEKYILKKIRS